MQYKPKIHLLAQYCIQVFNAQPLVKQQRLIHVVTALLCIQVFNAQPLVKQQR